MYSKLRYSQAPAVTGLVLRYRLGFNFVLVPLPCFPIQLLVLLLLLGSEDGINHPPKLNWSAARTSTELLSDSAPTFSPKVEETHL